VQGDSIQKVYDWIRGKNADAEIARDIAIVERFPSGPHEKSLKKVEIVVITPESMS
jgi:hypothetical protein